MRYAGKAKSVGASYTRGISEWNRDDAQNDRAMWIAYSSNKEDIWITRIPVPVRVAETKPVADDFDKMPAGMRIEGWNTYSPKWAPVSIAALPNEKTKCLRIEDRDPFDIPARRFALHPAS